MLNLFHKTSIKLTALYLTIIMLISLFFSFNIYQLSMQELQRGLGGTDRVFIDGPESRLPLSLQRAIQRQRSAIYREARDRVVGRLVLTNLVILVCAGIGSYYLARRTLEPMEDAHQAQSRFTADASHELRTPIAAMQSEIEVALMNPKLKLTDAKALLRSNLEELAKLTQLSNGLLQLAQLENLDIVFEPTAVKPLIADVINRVQPLADKKDMKLSFTAPENLQISAEPASFSEALLILLDNAIKYSPEKSVVTVAAKNEARSVVLTVKDTGLGIKASELPHIFDRFYRADSARTQSSTNGYGIGLAIAKNIVEQHRGTISAKSSPGVGTTFMIRLPKLPSKTA